MRTMANRRVGCRIDTATAVTYVFGPFTPGEYVDSFRVMLGMQTFGSSIFGVNCSIVALQSPVVPDIALAALLQAGRPLTDPNSQPSIPYQVRAEIVVEEQTPVRTGQVFDLPVSHFVDEIERYIGVRLDPDGNNLLGSIWVIPGRNPVENFRE